MRALVLSGGGSKGAYESGVVDYLINHENFRYDIICGVSVGALNAAFLAQLPMDHQDTAAGALHALWDGMSNSVVYKNWAIPYVSAAWKPSVYDSSPLKQLVLDHLNPLLIKKSGIKLRVGATALGSGDYKVFDETYDDLQQAVLASSAFPGLLTPVLLEGQFWVDGGVKSTTPLSSAITAGATTVDIVMCSPPTDVDASFNEGNKPNALSVAARSISLMSDKIQADDLKVCRLINQLLSSGTATGKRVVTVNIVQPSAVLVSNPLDFKNELLKQMYIQGLTDAAKVTYL